MVRKTRASNRGRAARPGGPFPPRREWAVSARGVSVTSSQPIDFGLLGGGSSAAWAGCPSFSASRASRSRADGSAGSAATRRSSSRRSVATSPRWAASQALSRWTWAGVDSAAGRCVRASRTTSIRLVAMAPAQPGAPDRDILRTAPQAGVEPTPGLVEGAGPDRQVRSTQPDPIVVGSQPSGPVEIRRGCVSTGVGFKVSSMCCRTSLMAGSSAPSPDRVQVFPSVLDEPLGFIDAAQLARNRHEQHEQGRPIIAGILGGVVDELLGGGELPGFWRRRMRPGSPAPRTRNPARPAPRLRRPPGFAPVPARRIPGGKRFPRSGPPSRTRSLSRFRQAIAYRPATISDSISAIALCNGDPSTKPSRPRRVPPRPGRRAAASIVAGSWAWLRLFPRW